MPKIAYKTRNFKRKSLAEIEQANAILEEYYAEGYSLTVRQLYYQFVARDWRPNNEKSYKALVKLASEARLTGLIDWHRLVDRTRGVRSLSHWNEPKEIIAACAEQFRVDHWKGQTHRVEVWVEKDALIDVVARACEPLDTPYLSCRGYTSQSEMWRAAQRLIEVAKGQTPVIIHLGDHDPSGLDMSRDIKDRLDLFCNYAGVHIEFKRVALNKKQIKKYKPPPNFTKLSDARAEKYVKEHGDNSWELDALNPSVINDLITYWIKQYITDKPFNRQKKITKRGRTTIKEMANEARLREEGIPSQWETNDIY